MLVITNGDLIAVHPAYYIQDYLESQPITKTQLANKLSLSQVQMNQLLAGKMQLDRHLIVRLATTFETSTELWQRLNDQYIDDRKKITISDRKAH